MKDCQGFLHIVGKGDSLYGLSRKYGVPLWAILSANPYLDVYQLQVGDEVCIPRRIQPRSGLPVDK
jgi:LysM repeat protein